MMAINHYMKVINPEKKRDISPKSLREVNK
jgi:hypothetical protein